MAASRVDGFEGEALEAEPVRERGAPVCGAAFVAEVKRTARPERRQETRSPS